MLQVAEKGSRDDPLTLFWGGKKIRGQLQI